MGSSQGKNNRPLPSQKVDKNQEYFRAMSADRGDSYAREDIRLQNNGKDVYEVDRLMMKDNKSDDMNSFWFNHPFLMLFIPLIAIVVVGLIIIALVISWLGRRMVELASGGADVDTFVSLVSAYFG